jgi:hypothetical protein
MEYLDGADGTDIAKEDAANADADADADVAPNHDVDSAGEDKPYDEERASLDSAVPGGIIFCNARVGTKTLGRTALEFAVGTSDDGYVIGVECDSNLVESDSVDDDSVRTTGVAMG